jgi:naphthalene 1,2-dioxygenase system ferredoxin subunit
MTKICGRMANQARRRMARLEDLIDGEVTAIGVEGREFAIYRAGTELFATDNLCTHGAGRLSDGFLEGYVIECPLHQGAFDIRTGIVTRAPARKPIATYAVEIEADEVYIILPNQCE